MFSRHYNFCVVTENKEGLCGNWKHLKSGTVPEVRCSVARYKKERDTCEALNLRWASCYNHMVRKLLAGAEEIT